MTTDRGTKRPAASSSISRDDELELEGERPRKLSRIDFDMGNDATPSWTEDLSAELCDMVINFLVNTLESPVNPLLGLIGKDLLQPDLRSLRLVSRKWNSRVLHSRHFSRRTALVRYTRSSLDRLLDLSRSEYANRLEVVAFALPNVDQDGDCPSMRRARVSPSLHYYDEVLTEILPRLTNLQSIWLVGTSNAVKGEVIVRRPSRACNMVSPLPMSTQLRDEGWTDAPDRFNAMVNRLQVKEIAARRNFIAFWVGKLYCNENLPPSIHIAFDSSGENRWTRPTLFRAARDGLRDCPGANCFVRTYSKARHTWGLFHPQIWKKSSDFHGDVTVLNIFREAEAGVFSVRGSPEARFEIDTFDRPTPDTPHIRLKKLDLSYIEVEAAKLSNIGSCQSHGMLEEVGLDNLVITSYYSSPYHASSYYSRFFDALATCVTLVNLQVSNLSYARIRDGEVNSDDRIQFDSAALERLVAKVNTNRQNRGMRSMAAIDRNTAFCLEVDEAADRSRGLYWPYD